MEEDTPETFVEYEPNQLASRGKRLAAAVVDIFIFFPLVVLVAQPLGLINISDPENIQAFNLVDIAAFNQLSKSAIDLQRRTQPIIAKRIKNIICPDWLAGFFKEVEHQFFIF